MLGSAAKKDVEVSKEAAPVEPEVVVPVGFGAVDWVAKNKAAFANHVLLTKEDFNAWKEASAVRGSLPFLEDGGKAIGSLRKRRNFVVALGDNLTEAERTRICRSFIGKKLCRVFLEPTDKTLDQYDQVTLPTDAESFAAVEYATSKEQSEAALAEWKMECKRRARVDSLKPGKWFTEQLDAWKKLKAEKQADKEAYADFSEEDWILANTRAELHYLLHAFIEDVNDEGRPGFTPANLGFYYKLYTSRVFRLEAFGCKKVEDFADLVNGVFKLDKGLMLPLVAKDADPMTFTEQTDRARIERRDRLDAGDENAALPFKAKSAAGKVGPPANGGGAKGANKGMGKGGKP